MRIATQNLSPLNALGTALWNKDVATWGRQSRIGRLKLFERATVPPSLTLPRSAATAEKFPVAILLALEPASVCQFGRSVSLATGLRRARTAATSDSAQRYWPGRIPIHVIKKAIIDRIGSGDSRDILASRIKDYIQWHLRDPDLSVLQIGHALNCTPRNLHRAFASENETISLYILNLRLERCRAELASPSAVARSITEIGFSWGFNNAAHFSKVFKKHYGYPPSAARTHGCRVAAESAD